MWNVCLDCGRQFTADHHTDECQYCWEANASIYANDPTYQYVAHRKPLKVEGAPPVPMPDVIVPEDMPRMKYRGGQCSVDSSHVGPFVSRIGRKTLCQECARTADRIALGVERRSA